MRKYKRRTGRKKRTYKKKKMVLYKKPTNNFSIKRMVWLENWAFNTVSTNGFYRYYAPTISQMQNFGTEFAQMFDMYRVNGIKVTFQPRYTDYEGGTGTIGVPYISLFVDQDSNLNPSGTYASGTYNSFLENANGRVKTRQLIKPVSVYYKPKVAIDLQGGLNPSYYKAKCWLSTANASTVIQRGFYAFIHDNNFANSSGTFSVDVFVTFYAQFKGNR